MILDKFTEFTNNGAIPAAAGTAVVGDVINIQEPGGTLRDIGNGQPIYWYVVIPADGEGGTSLQVQLTTGDNANLANADVVVQTGVVPVANLEGGTMLAMISLPIEGVPYKRYLGIKAVTVGAFTGGSLSSGLTLDPHGWKAYPGA